jgi:high-affinity iron transporter
MVGILGGSSNAPVGLAGAVAGISVASLIGYGIFKGGTRIDLSRFFKVTGVFLVIVAAGLVASSIHDFAEAGVVQVLQSPAIDLSGIIVPGSVQAGLATAFLGFQPVPTYAELVAWLLFLVPAGWYVLKPARPSSRLAS